jgi:hypothetical protein
MMTNGAVTLEETANNRTSPKELLHGGHHNDDTSRRAFRRHFERRGVRRNNVLPRERLHKMIVDGGFKRPTPKKWQK